MSKSWSSVPTLSIEMSPFCWWSLMKWWWTSMCFVLACWTGLLVSLIALSLSHSNCTCLNLIPKSLKVAFIQSNWAQQLSAKMYSASAVENATLFCFFDDQDTSDLPNSWHCPMCSFSQLCIPHNRSPNIQSTQILLLWDTTIQHFVYASSTSIFSWLASSDFLLVRLEI